MRWMNCLHKTLSSETHPNNPQDTYAFFRNAPKTFRETLARFFRNALKKPFDTRGHKFCETCTEHLRGLFRNASKHQRDTRDLEQRRRGRQRERQKTIVLISKTLPLHVRFTLYQIQGFMENVNA